MPIPRPLAALLLCFAAVLGLPPAAPAEPVAEAVSPVFTRHFESKEAADAAPPSPTFRLRGPRPEGPATTTIRPTFAAEGGKRTAKIEVPEGASLYGLPGVPGPLLRNGFVPGEQPVPCPWVLAVRPDGSSFGVLADTPEACRVSLEGGITFTTEAAVLPILVFEAPDPAQLLTNLNQATGRTEMPPLWALGYQQQALPTPEGLLAAANWLRDRKIPADALELPLETPPQPLDPQVFPNPKDLLDQLAARGFRVSAAISAAIPADSPLRESGTQADAWLADEARTPVAWAAPAGQAFVPDFMAKAARTWWESSLLIFLEQGFDAVSLRPLPDLAGPAAQSRPDEDLGPAGPLSRYISLLPTQLERSTRDGFKGEPRNVRPVVFSPRYFIASQQFAATIPNLGAAENRSPRDLLTQCLSLALSGQPLTGISISREMVAGPDAGRLIGLAAAMPLVRGDFPVAGEGVPEFPSGLTETLRQALDRRARLLPYYYTLCFNAFFECRPILAPVFFANPADPALRSVDSAFLLGSDLLVVPSLGEDQPKTLPDLGAGWRKLDWGDAANADLPDLYLRPGAILPLGPPRQHSDESPTDPLTLLINLDESGRATGMLYEDGGEGYEFYRNQARRIRYLAQVQDGALFVRLSGLDGGLPLPRRKLAIRLLTDGGEVTGEGSERGTIRIPLPAPDAPR